MRLGCARLLLILTALWLPLQTVAAVAMPLCMHGAPQQTQQHDEAMMHCEHGEVHEQTDSAVHDGDANGGHVCNACSFCHLAGVSALPASILMPPVALQAHDYTLPTAPVLISHIPEQPQRPPRTLA